MEALLAKIPGVISFLAMGLSSVVLIATAVVRLTPSKSDDATASKVAEAIHKVIKYFPTLGLNPKTKELEDALKNLSGDDQVAGAEAVEQAND